MKIGSISFSAPLQIVHSADNPPRTAAANQTNLDGSPKRTAVPVGSLTNKRLQDAWLKTQLDKARTKFPTQPMALAGELANAIMLGTELAPFAHLLLENDKSLMGLPISKNWSLEEELKAFQKFNPPGQFALAA